MINRFSLPGSTNLLSLACCGCLLLATAAQAHFPWIVLPEADSRKFSVVFSEGPWPDDPQYLARLGRRPAEILMADGTTIEVKLQQQDDRLVGELPTAGKAVAIRLPVDWGVISRGGSSFMLRYQAIGILDLTAFASLDFPVYPKATESTLPGLALKVKTTESGIQWIASQAGSPSVENKITLVGDSFQEQVTTDQSGVASFQGSAEQMAGVVGCYLKVDSTESGEFEDQGFAEAKNYLAVTFRPAEMTATSTATSIGNGPSNNSVTNHLMSESMTESEEHEDEVKRASVFATKTIQDLPELPIGITSFGAARCNDAIYIYGGHTGEAHHYWNESQSNELWKWDLTSDTPQWQVIAKGPRLQGLGMVSHGQYVIIVGGFTATNEQGDSHALFSQTDVKVFDTTTNQWTDKLNLPELPEGRSSHDAMIVKDHLYVVGGWKMDGDNSTEWHDTGLVADLTSANPSWETMPSPKFSRRAVTLVEFQDQLWVIGGMQQQGGPTLAVSIFDPEKGQWSDGPSLMGESGMAGFGVAAWSLQGKLMVSAHDGSLQVLTDDHQQWERIGYTRDTRFFHRMLPLDDDRLITLGGASMDSGKFLKPELVSLER